MMAGHDHALDLVGVLVDLGDLGGGGSFRRSAVRLTVVSARIQTT